MLNARLQPLPVGPILVNDKGPAIEIEMQDSFFRKYDREQCQAVIGKAAWLIRAAHGIGSSIVTMAEDIPNSGPLNDTINAALQNAAISRIFWRRSRPPDVKRRY